MPISYSTIYNCCLEKCSELGIQFDFDNNEHLQHPTTMDDIYKNLVYHSQNRSQGCAINFFKAESDGSINVAESIWNVINNHRFNLDDDFDYLNLFSKLNSNEFVRGTLSLEKGKDIQYIELAKTCQCIANYLSEYKTLDEFVENHIFSSDAKNNWTIIKRVASKIYNMSTELVPDFFKEQDCIKGREFLVKADIHVKRFFNNLYNKQLSDRKVYDILLKLYDEADPNVKQLIPPYKIDKLVYLIGEHFGDPEASKQFANWVLECCDQQNNI